jgi:hypothetical protein
VPAELDITSTRQAMILRISGALDGSRTDVDLLLDAVATVPPPPLVVFDLRKLILLAAHGVRTLRTVVDALEGRGVRCHLVLTPGSVPLGGIQVTGLLDLVPVSGTTDEALAAGPGLVDAEIGVDTLAERFTALTRVLLNASSVEAVLQRIVVATAELIPGADVVSVTLRSRDGALSTPATTDKVAEELDQVQYRTGEGPCLEAAEPDGPAYAASADLVQEERWPQFAAAAVGDGLRSVLSTDLFPVGTSTPLTGALNIYSYRSGALNADARHIAFLLATHASLALAYSHAVETHRRQEANLRRAIHSRDIIGQAKGILMARQGLTADEAFDLLSRTSQDLNIKLVELADTIARRHTELDQP